MTQGLNKLSCPDAGILSRLFTGICWSSMFPLRIAGFSTFHPKDGIEEPYNATKRMVCTCRGGGGQLPTVGLTVGFWTPSKLIETTRYPYCSPTLGGISLNGSNPSGAGPLGRGALGGDGALSGFRHFNMYSFPLMTMLQMMNVPGCSADNTLSLDLAEMSMFYPQWDAPESGFFLNPETAFFANPVAMLALPVSCTLASSGISQEADDMMFWAMGCWGMSYPVNGYHGNSSSVTGSSLVMARALFMMARLPWTTIAYSRVGDDAIGGTCEPVYRPMLQKSAYKVSMMFPVSESTSGIGGAPTAGAPINLTAPPVISSPSAPSMPSNGSAREIDFSTISGGRCAHRIGETSLRWGEWRTRPGTGEDQVYMLWQWVDCCVGVF
ncbi:TraU family protein [Cupriavidus malaysiensis]|uniref:TraU family protein n=1 Tax=Cupriavidus malaysiensis TaxID=367825 RepID=UPI003003880D